MQRRMLAVMPLAIGSPAAWLIWAGCLVHFGALFRIKTHWVYPDGPHCQFLVSLSIFSRDVIDFSSHTASHSGARGEPW